MHYGTKYPLSLCLVLYLSIMFGLGMVSIGYMSIPNYLDLAKQYSNLAKQSTIETYYNDLILMINLLYFKTAAGVLLLVASVGILFKKRIAHWLMIVSWMTIMITGLYFKYTMEIKYGKYITFNPMGFIPDLFWYGLVPIAIMSYLIIKREEIEEFIETKELHLLEKFIAVIIVIALFMIVKIIGNIFFTIYVTSTISFFLLILVGYFQNRE